MHSSPRPRRHHLPDEGGSPGGFTLVEVVAGLVLLAGLIVGVLLSFSAHHRQLRFAQDRLAAVELADTLLMQWQGQPSGVPRSSGGVVPTRPSWWWRTLPVGQQLVMGLPMEIVRLEIGTTSPTTNEARVLSRVDVLSRLLSQEGRQP